MSPTSTRRVRLDGLTVFPLLPLLSESAGPQGNVEMPGRTENGIDCLPSGEVVGGYSHYRALRAQGASTAPVCMRPDLDALRRDVLGLHVLRAYLAEMAADDAARAQLFRVWDEWRRTVPRTGRRVTRRLEIDAAIQAVLGVSRRTLLRHRTVQSLAPAVKDRLAGLALPNWALERITRLRVPEREKLLTELRDADDVREALKRQFPDVASKRHKKAGDALAAFARGLKAGLADLAGREGDAVPLAGRHAPTLREARTLIDRLLGDTPAAGAAEVRP